MVLDPYKLMQQQRPASPKIVKTPELLAYEKQVEDYNRQVSDEESRYQRELEEYNTRLNEYNKQVELNKREQEQYEKDLAEYNRLQAEADAAEKLAEEEYQKELEIYNKQLEEYNKAKAEYEAQEQEYAREAAADRTAYKLYWKAKEGKNPYISDQTPLVQKYYYYYQNKDDAKIAAELAGKAQTLEEYKQIYESMTPDIQKYAVAPVTVEAQYNKKVQELAKTIPEGFQGMTTKEGIVITPIPGKSTITFDPLGQPMSAIKPVSPFAVKEPVKSQITKTIEPIKVQLGNLALTSKKNLISSTSYTDLLGQGVSYNPLKADPFKNSALLAFQPTDPKNITKQNLVWQVQVRREEPFKNTISSSLKVPTSYKEFTEGNRYIGGTLDWLGYKSKSLVSKQPVAIEDYKPFELRGSTSPEQPYFKPLISSSVSLSSTPMEINNPFYNKKESISAAKTELVKGTFSDVIRTTPYFIPFAGAGIAILEGGESYLTSGGRKKISEETSALVSKGYNPVTSSFISSAKPILFSTAGVLGLKGEFKAAKSIKEIKTFEESPILIKATRYEGKDKGFDIIKAYKEVGSTKYSTEIKQPFYKVGKRKIVAEEGLGISFKTIGTKSDVIVFESGGVSKSFKGNVRASNLLIDTGKEPILDNIIKVSKEIKAKPGIARTYVKPIAKGEIKGTYVKSAVGGIDDELRLEAKYKPVEAKKVYEDFISVGRYDKEKKVYTFAGGVPSKLKINRWSLEPTISAEPKVYGTVKVKRIKTPSTDKDQPYKIFISSQSKTPLSKTFSVQEEKVVGLLKSRKATAAYTGSLAKSGIETLKPEVVKVSMIEKSSTPILSSAYAGKGTYERYRPSENIYNIKINKPVETREINLGDNIFETSGGLGENSYTLNIDGKFGDLNDLGRFKNLGVAKSRLSSFEEIEPVRPKTRLIESSKDILKPKDSFISTPKFVEEPVQKRRLVFNQPSKLKEDTKQISKQRLIIKSILDNPNISKQKPVPFTSITFKVPPPVIPSSSRPSSKTRQKLVSMIKGYNVLLRSKGQVKVVGKNLPYNKALQLGARYSKSSTAQTFALKESGTTRLTDINYQVPKTLFTTPKQKRTYITPLTFVERRGKTLTERREVKDILKANRRASAFYF